MRALGPIMCGWVVAVQEHSPEGIVQSWQDLDTYRSTGVAAAGQAGRGPPAARRGL